MNSGWSERSVHSNRTASVGRDDGPGVFEPAQGEFPVERVREADGVGGDLDAEAQAQQLQRRLGDADVGLDPDQGDVADLSAVELLEELAAPRSSGNASWRPVRDQLGELGDGRAEPLGILLGGPDGDAEQPRRPDQADGVGDHELAVAGSGAGASPGCPRPAGRRDCAVNRSVRRH